MKQTAVEWLHEIAKQREPDKFDWQQAKAMEKGQMIDFALNYLDDDEDITALQYYNKTYGGNK